MSITLENQIVGASLYKPDLFKQHEIDMRWLADKKNKEIISTLKDYNGHFESWTDLLMKIQNKYPFTTWDEDSLEQLSFRFHELPDYEKGVKLLKVSIYQDKVKLATERYQNEPSENNLQHLKDCIRELDDVQKVEDTGELTPAVHTLMDEIENGTEQGLKTYPHLDNVLGGGLRGGMLVTIGAGTGVGKTAFTLNLIVEMLKNQPEVAIDFFALEMSKKEMLDRFISRFVHISSYKIKDIKNKATDEEKEKALKIAHRLNDSGLRVHESLYQLGQIERQIRRRASECEAEGVKYIPIIDYIGLVNVGNINMPRYLQVGEITRTFKMLTNELNIPLIALSQLNRGVSNRQDKRPTLADLRESGSVEQDSNVVMFLYKDEDEDDRGYKQDTGVVELIIAKNRGGYTSTINYQFTGSKMYFEELD